MHLPTSLAQDLQTLQPLDDKYFLADITPINTDDDSTDETFFSLLLSKTDMKVFFFH